MPSFSGIFEREVVANIRLSQASAFAVLGDFDGDEDPGRLAGLHLPMSCRGLQLGHLNVCPGISSLVYLICSIAAMDLTVLKGFKVAQAIAVGNTWQ